MRERRNIQLNAYIGQTEKTLTKFTNHIFGLSKHNQFTGPLDVQNSGNYLEAKPVISETCYGKQKTGSQDDQLVSAGASCQQLVIESLYVELHIVH